MQCWRALPQLLEHQDVVLVTVARTQGSAPREAGTHMLVTLTQTVDTIGGGHLEWEAMAQARAMLQQPHAKPALLRFSLGATLGQCCGGVVWLVFERVGRAARVEWIERSELLAAHAITRTLVSRDNGSQWMICEADESVAAAGTTTALLSHATTPSPATDAPYADRLEKAEPSSQAWMFTETIAPPTFNITLFGAGHVGAAIVRILATLDARIRWVDVRDDLFSSAPALVECIATDAPEDEVGHAPPNSFFLVLTHSHTLDLRLTERILQRDAFAWFGLIGSRTKRARFEHRLLARGIASQALARMTCPIGIAGIRDKSPQAIAIAVVAQLLQARELHTAHHNGSIDKEAMHDH